MSDLHGTAGGQRAVLRNIAVLGVAQAATMLLNLAALVHIALTVGDTWFGVLQWGVAFSAYALIVAEWGLATLAVREISRLPSTAAVQSFARTHLGLMMSLGVLVMALGAVALPVFPMFRTDPVILLVYLATIIPFMVSLDWVGIGLQRLTTVSVVKTLRSFLYALAVLLLLRKMDGVGGWTSARWVPVFFWVAWIVAAAVMAWRVRGWLGGWVRPEFGPLAEWRQRLRATAPIGAGAITLRVLLNIDIVLLGFLAVPAVVGNYAAAAKVVFVLTIAVEVVWKALLPRLSLAWTESPDLSRRRFSFYLGLVLLVLVPVAVGGVILGDDLMVMLYDDSFPDAGTVCRILSVSYVALAVGQFCGNGLIATDRQSRYFPPLAVGAVVAVVAVILLGSRQGGIGAAWGMLAAHSVLAVATATVARDLIVRALWRPVASAVAGAAIMTVVLGALPGWHLVARVAVAIAVYGAVASPLALGWLRREVRGTGL